MTTTVQLLVNSLGRMLAADDGGRDQALDDGDEDHREGHTRHAKAAVHAEPRRLRRFQGRILAGHRGEPHPDPARLRRRVHQHHVAREARVHARHVRGSHRCRSQPPAPVQRRAQGVHLGADARYPHETGRRDEGHGQRRHGQGPRRLSVPAHAERGSWRRPPAGTRRHDLRRAAGEAPHHARSDPRGRGRRRARLPRRRRLGPDRGPGTQPPGETLCRLRGRGGIAAPLPGEQHQLHTEPRRGRRRRGVPARGRVGRAAPEPGRAARSELRRVVVGPRRRSPGHARVWQRQAGENSGGVRRRVYQIARQRGVPGGPRPRAPSGAAECRVGHGGSCLLRVSAEATEAWEICQVHG